jgi:hypothetical protein
VDGVNNDEDDADAFYDRPNGPTSKDGGERRRAVHPRV